MSISSRQQVAGTLPRPASLDSQTAYTTTHWASPSRNQIIVWFILLSSALFLFLHDYYSVQIGVSYDDARYIILARSLLQGETYGLIYGPGEPAQAFYPFGFPLLLTPVVWLVPDNLQALRLTSLLATIINAGLLFWGWRWVSRHTSNWWSLAVVALYLLSPLTVEWSRAVMSEAPFLTYCLLALFLTQLISETCEHSIWRPLVLGTLLTMAAFTRTVGIVLVGTVFLHLMMTLRWRSWRPIAVTTVQMVLFATCIVYATPVTTADLIPIQYLKQGNSSFVNGIVQRVTGSTPTEARLSERYIAETSETDGEKSRPTVNLKLLFSDFFVDGARQHLGQDVRLAVIPVGGGEREQEIAGRLGVPFLPRLFGYFVSTLIAVGLARWLYKDGITAFALFAIFYFLALQVWVWNGARLLYPIQPQLFFGFMLGIHALLLGAYALLRRQIPLSAKMPQAALQSTVAILVILSIVASLRMQPTQTHTGDVEIRTEWIRSHSQPTDIIMTEVPELDYLYSDRLAVWYPGICDTAGNLQNYLTANNVDYILVAPKLEWEPQYTAEYSDLATCFAPIFETLTQAGQLELVYSSEPTMIRVFRTTY